MPSSLPFRLARTAVFAVVCLSLGMVAHSLAGGSVPGPAMVAGFFVAAGGAYPLAGRERGPRAILALLGGLQLVLHVMFSLSHAVSPAAGAAHAAHASAGLAPDLGMFVAHGWAVGLTALWLARGEAALWGCCAAWPHGSSPCCCRCRRRRSSSCPTPSRRCCARRSSGMPSAGAGRPRSSESADLSDDRRPGDFRRGRRKACP
ncbi:hypothetical protein ACFQE7_26115 [Nonomuraea ferruginea]|uniref:hypothetical protein n=1 Tax=Nonomuraea ferruginea TaxID=46174 RepID=UPI0036221D64